jgi:hypothetical protein
VYVDSEKVEKSEIESDAFNHINITYYEDDTFLSI